MFRPSAEAPARATRVAAVLEEAGHKVTLRPLGRTPAALYRVIRDSPEVVHACGVRSWRLASLAARLTGAACVYEALAEGGGDGLGLPRRAIIHDRGAVLAQGDRQARQLRAGMGLTSLPPVVTGLESGGGSEAGRVLVALYDRLPELDPRLPAAARRQLTAWGRRLIDVGGDAVRGGGLLHPLALAAYLVGRGRRARGRPREAARALARARRSDPEKARYGLELAIALREGGERDQAAKQLRMAEAQVGDADPWTLGEVGIEFARLGLRAEAQRAAVRLNAAAESVGNRPVKARFQAQAALVSVALGDLRAARDLDSSLAAGRSDRRAQRAAALALERAGEPTRALELAGRSDETAQQRRLSGLLLSLDPAWRPQLPATRPEHQAPRRRVLCLLEVSLPHAPSGYAYRSRDLLHALRGADLDPVVATRLGFPAGRGIADYSPVEDVDGIIHHRFNVPGLRRYSDIPLDCQLQRHAECLLQQVERTGPGLVLAGTPNLNGVVAAALRAAAGTPFVYDVRGFPEMSWAIQSDGSSSELYRRRREAETCCASDADAVITLSETMKDVLTSRGLDPGTVTVVPHVVDTDRYSPRARDQALARSYGLEGSFVVGSVSTLTEWEGIDHLLRAVALARRERPEIRALIVGDGPARPQLEALTSKLGLERAVTFTGRVDQARIPEHYGLLDVFALPRPDQEVCRAVTPLKPVEAMAMGLPVIASDLPALAEPLLASGGGLLVEPGSDAALAAAILELAGDQPVRQQLALNAREHAIENHAPARASETLRSLLIPLLNRGLDAS